MVEPYGHVIRVGRAYEIATASGRSTMRCISEVAKVACTSTPPVNNPTEPAPQGRPANTGLANTGASVVWLTVAGVGVLGLGGGLVLFGRHRKATSSR